MNDVKVFCEYCKHYYRYFGDWDFYESCKMGKKFKTDDTYLEPGRFVQERPGQKNKFNNCNDYEKKSYE